jgi:hypothetical protein
VTTVSVILTHAAVILSEAKDLLLELQPWR